MGAIGLLGSKRAGQLQSLELPWNRLTPALIDWLLANELPPLLRVFHLPWEVTRDLPVLSLAALGDRHTGVDFGLRDFSHGVEATLRAANGAREPDPED